MNISSTGRVRHLIRGVVHALRWFAEDTLPRVIFGSADRLIALITRADGDLHETDIGPVVMLMPSHQFRLVRWRILTWLQLDGTGSSRVHSGIIVPRSDETVEVMQGPYEPTEGRRIKSSTRSIRPGVEYRDVMAAMEAIKLEPKYRLPTVRELMMSRVEVLALSSVTPRVWHRMRRSRFLRRRLLMLGTFDPTNVYARTYLWNQLPLSAAVGKGVWFERLQDSPDYGWPATNDSFEVDGSYAREPRHAVLFDDYGDETYFERGASAETFPAPLLPIASLGAPTMDPSSQAVGRLRAGTTRISGQDDGSAATRFALAPTGLRYPDPMSQIDKIVRYCLSTSHLEQKWRGFASAGYEAARADDAHLLAGTLCSSLLLGPPIRDARTTADGKLQFGVDLALPGRSGGYWPVTTSWLLTPTDSPRLATAFVATAAAVRDLGQTLTAPESVGADLSSIAAYVEAESERYASDRHSDGASSFGWLWIRHDHPRSAEFARWLRRSGSAPKTIFARRRMGGRVTQWPLAGVDGASTEARLAMAQCLLLIFGIQAHRELVWD